MYFFYYLPVGIDVKTRRTPVLTPFFALVCTVVFLFARYGGPAASSRVDGLVYYPGFSGPLTALTTAFVHFGWLHLLGNLVYLVLFGWYLEDRLGPVRFAVVFLGAAVLGSLAQGWFNQAVLHLPPTGIVGASGAVAGVLGAFLVRLYLARVRVAYWVFMPLQGFTRGGRVDVPVVFAIALWVLIQVVRSLVQMGGAAANVAYVTHISGFAVGLLLVPILGEWRRAREDAHRTKAQRYLRKGELYGAQDELSGYVALRPQDGEAHADLARVMVQTGDDLGAQANYLKACELLLRANERGRAEEVYQEALRGYPEFCLSSEPQLDLAFGLERNLKPETALAAYERFCARFPRHDEAPFALLRSANLHAKLRADGDSARRCYEQIIRHYPDDPWVDFAREQVRRMA